MLLIAIPLQAQDAKPPDGWKEVTAKKNAYRVWVPTNGELSETRENVPLKIEGRTQTLTVDITTLDRKDKSIFIASRLTVPADLLKSSKPNERQAMYRDHFISAVKGKLIEQKEVAIGKVKGTEYMIETPKGFARFRLYGTSSIVYRVAIIGTKEQVNSKDAETFFDSFKTPSMIKTP